MTRYAKVSNNAFCALPLRWKSKTAPHPSLTIRSPPQGSSMAKQISAPYIECSAQQSENSVRDIFHVATLACVNKNGKNVKRSKTARATKRISHMPGRPDLAAVASDLRKDKARSCSVMWLIKLRGNRLTGWGTEHGASRKLRGTPLSSGRKTHFVPGKEHYKIQFTYKFPEHAAPMTGQSRVPLCTAPSRAVEEVICQRATCSGSGLLPASCRRTKRMQAPPTGAKLEKWCHWNAQKNVWHRDEATVGRGRN